jgi:hypothetical protein
MDSTTGSTDVRSSLVIPYSVSRPKRRILNLGYGVKGVWG